MRAIVSWETPSNAPASLVESRLLSRGGRKDLGITKGPKEQSSGPGRWFNSGSSVRWRHVCQCANNSVCGVFVLVKRYRPRFA